MQQPTGTMQQILPARVVEFLRFSAVGCSGIAVNLGAYYALTRMLAVPMAVASPIAIELSVIWNFALNDVWTFGGRRLQSGLASRIGRFHAVSLAAGLMNYSILLLLARAGWWDMVANLVGIAAGALVKFAVNSAWTWRELGADPRPPTLTVREERAQ
jgi:dolichol-phosphate mannosyltransferase